MSSDVRIQLPEANYSLIETERDGMPAVVVLNDAVLSFDARDLFPWHLEIVIRAAKVGRNGMPTRAESAALDEIGDAIEGLLEETRTEQGSLNALFLARVTCDSQREQLYRIHDADLANSALQRAISTLTAREWSFSMAADKRWAEVDVYQALANSVRD